jgi:AP-3 complex subunit delta-1
MVGYNVSWAAFSIIEVMSQPRFAHKRIGYLAANHTFDDTTDVILLTTNLFKKEFAASNNQNQYEVGMAVNCLANIATKELARDCISDLVTLMNHSKPYIRKKAILAMYKLYIKFPQGLRLTFDRLKERLDDAESSVISTAVNVICELANKNPKNYLAMAPKFFKLLTTSSNNWMLIKVVKLLGSLVSEEPRLARKLLDPLITIIKSTGAKSLQYECISTITEALPYSRREDGSEAKNATEVIAICSDYLRGFIEDSDQNLKYLGLVGLCNLMRSSPRSVVDHRDLILGCLNDDDVTIRTKALELLAGIASKKSLVDLVHHLLDHAHRSEGSYRDEIISKILWMCKKDKYLLVQDFAWYVSILLDLAVMQGARHGCEVADQLMEIALRVEGVRPFAVDQLLGMLLNEQLMVGHAKSTVVEVLRAAAWVTAEYAEVLTRIAHDRADDGSDSSDSDSDEEDEIIGDKYWIEGAAGEDHRSLWRGQPLHYLVMKTLLSTRSTLLPPSVQIVFLQAVMKLFVRVVLDGEFSVIADCVGLLRVGLSNFTQHMDLEVQERATTLRHLLASFRILPLDWEQQFAAQEEAAAAQWKKAEETQSSSENLIDLMSMMMTPVYDATSVRSLDENGAREAIAQKAVLGALIKEIFYAVHTKAQRKVPVPADLALDLPFNASAITKLVKTALPEDLSLATLTFVREKEPLPNFPISSISANTTTSAIGFNTNANNIVPAITPAFPISTDSRLDNALDDIFTSSSSAPMNSNRNQNRGEDDVFILKQSGQKLHQELMPLSKLLGEFEEIPSSQNTKKHSKKQKKQEKDDRKKHNGSSKKRKEQEQQQLSYDQQVEMLPAGAQQSDSDDEADANLSTSQKKKQQQNRRSKQPSDEDAALDSIDITTPLQADEVLPIQKHRVVSSVATTAASRADNQEEEEEKDKKKKKQNKKEKKDSKQNNKGDKTAAEYSDLLGLDWPATDSAPAVEADVLLLDTTPATSLLVPTAAEAPTGDKKSKKNKSSRMHQEIENAGELLLQQEVEESAVDGCTWFGLYTGAPCEVRYGLRSSSSFSAMDEVVVDVFFEAVRSISSSQLSSITSTVTIEIELQPHVLVRNCAPTSCRVTLQLPSSTSSKHHVSRKHLQLTLSSPTALYSARLLTCTAVLHVRYASATSDALLLPSLNSSSSIESLHTSQQLHIPASLFFFEPYVLSATAFADKLSKASSKWAKQSMSLNIARAASSKKGSGSGSLNRQTFQRFAEVLRAHVVESESSKAVTLACKSQLDGTRIFVLCKKSKASSVLSVDVKCLGHSSVEEAQAALAVVIAALEYEGAASASG